MNFETVIGLEVHMELRSESKLFSTSPVAFGSTPNVNTNEKDWAYPGALPVMNKHIVDLAMQASLALNCDISRRMSFDRKSYFYPDNPSAYQITQDNEPIGRRGHIDITVDGKTRRIRINRVHIEEDAGKLIHGTDGFSYVDLNRQGTALIEIVSEADLRSADEAYAYLEALRETILYTGASDVKLEEGSMRADANISLRPVGQEEFGTKTELKNLNSLNHIRKGIQYEEKRQAEVLRSGGVILQETRRFDEPTGRTLVMRLKETAADYHYFPEPDVPPMTISEEWIQTNLDRLPEMPGKRRERYVNEYDLPEYDAMVLTQTKEMSDFFDAAVNEGADPKLASNWLMGEVSAYMNKEEVELADMGLTPVNLAQMIKLIDKGTISSKIAKQLFQILAKEGGDADKIVEEKGMAQLSDPSQLQPIIDVVIAANQQSVEDFKAGKDRAKGFLVGQIMQKTRGKANPQMVNQLLDATLKSL